MAEIIDGNLVAQKIHEQTALEAKNLREVHGIQPGLAVVLIGEDAASKVYVTMKEKKS